MSIIVEIRAAEGGADAKDLVSWYFGIYSRYAARRGLDVVLLDNRAGQLVFRVEGRDAEKAFENESGGHRVQRVPPTEKRGRVQTSTVTVAVLPVPKQVDIKLPEKDLRWTTCRGSGAGGQHRNVTDSAVQLKHLPTGIMVRIESERSQTQNKERAREVLYARLLEHERARRGSAREATRREQVGSGMRGDKRRTIRVKDGTVKDHVTGRSWDFKKYQRGDWD